MAHQRTGAEARVQRPSADATRARIVAAAIDVFADRSFDGAATREIAAKAGVTQPLLNYHFSSKDELWRVAVGDLFDALSLAMATRAEGLRGVDELTATKLLIREFVLFSAHRPQLHRIITGECKTDGERMDWVVEKHIRPIFDVVTAMFDDLAASGALPTIAPLHLYYLLIGAGPTMFVLAPECRRLTGVDPFSTDVIEAHADAVITLLFDSHDKARP